MAAKQSKVNPASTKKTSANPSTKPGKTSTKNADNQPKK